MTDKKNSGEVDRYISTFPEKARERMEELRTLIQKAAPKAEEVISYKMPAYKQYGVLVYFAGYKNHIGFYPTASPIDAFKDELSSYKTSKGAIQFEIDKAIPKGLVARIVKYRIKEDKERAEDKSKTKNTKK